MNKLGIVVLNYKTCFDTIECVNSLINQQYEKLEIIIIDNYSQDGSYEKLQSEFSHIKNIHIIENDENLGFARGNNIGIIYAREQLKCEFVFILNSDTVFTDKHICSILVNTYTKEIGLINPACCNVDGSFQKPYGKFRGNLYWETVIHLIFIIWSFVRNILKWDISLSDKFKEVDLKDMDKYKYIVQGPAYILTPSFFEYYNKLFPKTFLYEEELILAWYINKAKLKTSFVNSPYIIHKEAVSSKELVKSNKKLFMQLKSIIKAIPIFFMNKENIKKYY